MTMQQKKIMVVDDNPDILLALQGMLEDAGYIVMASEQVQDLFLAMCDTSDLPDVLLLDMLLSGQHGQEIIKQLKSQDSTKHIPIILFSAYPSAEEEAYRAGANDFIAKPFDIDVLLAKIEQYTS
jgi:CheY-like chemotaxis protein